MQLWLKPFHDVIKIILWISNMITRTLFILLEVLCEIYQFANTGSRPFVVNKVLLTAMTLARKSHSRILQPLCVKMLIFVRIPRRTLTRESIPSLSLP